MPIEAKAVVATNEEEAIQAGNFVDAINYLEAEGMITLDEDEFGEIRVYPT